MLLPELLNSIRVVAGGMLSAILITALVGYALRIQGRQH
jgi:hypothetical protein